MTYLSAGLSILILVVLGVVNYQLGAHVQAKWPGWVIPALFFIIRVIETFMGGTNAAEKVGGILGGLIFGWLFWWLFQRGWRKVRPELAAKEDATASATKPTELNSQSLTAMPSQSTSLRATPAQSASATAQAQASLSASNAATSSQSTSSADHTQH